MLSHSKKKHNRIVKQNRKKIQKRNKELSEFFIFLFPAPLVEIITQYTKLSKIIVAKSLVKYSDIHNPNISFINGIPVYTASENELFRIFQGYESRENNKVVLNVNKEYRSYIGTSNYVNSLAYENPNLYILKGNIILMFNYNGIFKDSFCTRDILMKYKIMDSRSENQYLKEIYVDNNVLYVSGCINNVYFIAALQYKTSLFIIYDTRDYFTNECYYSFHVPNISIHNFVVKNNKVFARHLLDKTKLIVIDILNFSIRVHIFQCINSISKIALCEDELFIHSGKYLITVFDLELNYIREINLSSHCHFSSEDNNCIVSVNANHDTVFAVSRREAITIKQS